jgi:hypothetical protein
MSVPRSSPLRVLRISGGAGDADGRCIAWGLGQDVRLWVGGSGARDLELPRSVESIASLEDLERRVTLLALEGASTQ